MRTVIFIAAAWLALSSAALAQSGAGGNGDAPHNKGSTGWTGPHPETGGVTLDKGGPRHPKSETTGQSVKVHDQDAAKSKPLMATGEDLKGPPTRFPPSKTSE